MKKFSTTSINPNKNIKNIDDRENNSKQNRQKNGERIAKVIANAGYCSRRDAEKLITSGSVKVNGKITTELSTIITDQSIKINNKLLQRKTKTRLWIFHKPRGYMVTNDDPLGRKTIYELLPKNLGRIISVGRLDMDTEGLLLLTNSGNLARYMELPSTAWSRQYLVKVHGPLDRLLNNRDKIEKSGIRIKNMNYAPIKIEIEKASGTTNNWLRVKLTEGKNREIRNLMEYFGLRVMRLIRVSFGPFHLGNLQKGFVKPVSDRALRSSVAVGVLE